MPQRKSKLHVGAVLVGTVLAHTISHKKGTPIQIGFLRGTVESVTRRRAGALSRRTYGVKVIGPHGHESVVLMSHREVRAHARART